MWLNEDFMRLEMNGQHVQLTLKQYRLVHALYTRNRIVVRNDLMDAVDPNLESAAHERSLDSIVKHVRKKLRAEFGMDDWIKTVSGVGYYWDHTDPEKMDPRGWKTYLTTGKEARGRFRRKKRPYLSDKKKPDH